MSGFSADWLSLREPVDRRSRDESILAAIASYFRGRANIAVTDLACGQGSLLRALRGYLPARQHWLLIDNDEALLAIARREESETILVESRLADLNGALEDILARPADLVVSTAFSDLVSDAWLARLARAVATAAMPVYLALTYDGQMVCRPHHSLDEDVMAAFNRHQRGDKGFGPALGPDAAAAAERRFTEQGYDVLARRSDWRLAAVERSIQEQMVLGWFAAAGEIATVAPAALAEWRDRRLAWIAEGRSDILVGHVDLWATPRRTG